MPGGKGDEAVSGGNVVSKVTITNVAASVRQKLLNRAKNDRRPFHELLQYYAMERFLYRLSCSEHSERFVLKGALMLRIWSSDDYRSTMDIDMLGKTSNDLTAIELQIREILKADVPSDGLVFLPDTIQCANITEDADYKGVRVRFQGVLDSARIAMQVDIGFGDIVYPAPEIHLMPTFLDQPPPRVLCYSRESAIAEKFEAMVRLGDLNSRMKDFYDIWQLSRQFDFDGTRLVQAMKQTFEHRETSINMDVVFTDAFVRNHQVQWKAFIKRLLQPHQPEQFSEILIQVRSFLLQPAVSLAEDRLFSGKWLAPGPWQPATN
jgi:predicted nucleotidyltransferase component of viral defense system